jgi:Na+/proline symporter
MTSGVGMALIWRWLTSTATQDALHASGWTSLADFSQWATRSEIQAVLPAFLVSALLLVVVSLLGDPPDEERAHAFERAASGGSDAPTQEPSAAGGTSST